MNRTDPRHDPGRGPLSRAMRGAVVGLLALALAAGLWACPPTTAQRRIRDLNDSLQAFFLGLQAERWMGVSTMVVPERRGIFLSYWRTRGGSVRVAEFQVEGAIFDNPGNPRAADVQVRYAEFRNNGLNVRDTRVMLHWVLVRGRWLLEDEAPVTPDGLAPANPGDWTLIMGAVPAAFERIPPDERENVPAE